MQVTARRLSSRRMSPALFWSVAIFSIFFSGAPVIRLLMGPITQFTTIIHEFGHAFVCVATGGHVGGMTIVSDGIGHGGLTWCQGGSPFLYTQAGYLGTAVAGAVLLYLAQFPQRSRIVLRVLGAVIGAGTLLFVGANMIHMGWNGFWPGFCSLLWGLVMGGFLLWAGLRWHPGAASLLLMYLAVQTAFSSVTDLIGLVAIYVGLVPINTFSDASSMSQLTGVPALVWSLFWVACSVLIVGATMWSAYGIRHRQ